MSCRCTGLLIAAALFSGGLAAAAEPQALGEAASATPPVEPDRPAPSTSHEHFSVAAFGAVGLPRPLAVGGMVRFEGLLGLGAEYSLLPKVTFSGGEARFWAVSATARIFPFRNSFFIGMSGGRQHLDVAASTPIGVAEILADCWFLNPYLGFLKVFPSGITVGIDAGVQIPFTATFSSDVPSLVPGAPQVVGIARILGKGTMPTVNLLRLGFAI